MIINGRTGIPSRDKKIRELFKKHAYKLDLLFLDATPKSPPVKMTLEELQDTLEQGEGIMWEISEDRFIPYNRVWVLHSLNRQNLIDRGLIDVFADYESRL